MAARLWAQGLAAALVCWAAQGCMSLDGFLFAPTKAADDADLFASATEIPPSLKTEIRGAIITADGVDVSAWALTHDSNEVGDRTFVGRHQTGIVYCHGNNQNMGRFALRAQALWAMGYTVLAFDYRGYGKTRGEPTEQGTYLDATAARAFVSQERPGLGIPEDRVALYGYSLGAAVCSQLAVDAPTQALVLESPFASVASLVGDDTALGLPQVGFTRARYDTQNKLRHYDGALLIMHGTWDRYLMPRYGQQVWQAASRAEPSVFVPVDHADHETVPCTNKDKRSPVPGGCLGGIDPNYNVWVTSLIDSAIAPTSSP